MSDANLPRIAGRYRLLSRVTRTNHGSVWAAEDERSGQSVAVRLLERGADEPERVATFRSAWLAAARLTHPYLARVLDEGLDRSGPFVVSEWVDGHPLEAWVGRAPPWGFVRSVCTQLCDVLAYLHAHEWVHLDIRPSAVAVRRTAEGPRICLLSPGALRVEHGLSDVVPGARLTVKTRGSVRYLAPEVADSPPWALGPATDLYGLGLVLWSLLTGSVPFGERDGVALMLARRGEPAPSLPAGVGGAHHGPLSALLLRLLAPNPTDRPRSAAEVSAALIALDAAPEWSEPRALPQLNRVPFTPARIPVSAFPLANHAPPRLVERDTTLDALWQSLQATARGYGSRLVVLEGPAATAKTDAVRFVAEHAAVRGVARTWAVRFEADQAPGSGLAMTLERLVRGGGASRSSVRARALEMLTQRGADDAPALKVLPVLLRPDDTPFAGPANAVDARFAQHAIGEGEPPPGRAHRMAAVFLRLLRATTRQGPILLWLDDAHAGAEGETLALAEAILSEADLAVCVAVTLRREHPAVARWRERLPGDGDTVRWCSLDPLSEDGRLSLAASRLDADPELARRVAHITGQHPEIIGELYDLLLDGQLASGPEGATLRTGSLLPDGPEEVRHARFRRLPAQGGEVLVPDVVAGLAFARVPLTPTVIAALQADDPNRPYGKALLAAERARWVVRSQGGEWHFASPEQAAWLRRLQGGRSESWHRRWLRALSRLEGGARGRLGLERAGHAAALGDDASTLQALLDATAWCLGPAEPDTERGLQAANEALRLAASKGDRPKAARAARLRAELWRHAGDPERARQSLQVAEAHLTGLADTAEAAWCALTGGWLAYDDGMVELAERRFRAAGEVFEKLNDAAAHWVTVGLGHAALARGDTAAARQLGRTAELAFDGLGAVRGGLAARLLRAQAADVAGDDPLAEARYKALQDLAQAHHWLGDIQVLRVQRAVVALRAGRAHDAAALLDAVETVAQALDWRVHLDFLAAVRPALAAALGDLAGARAALECATLPVPALRMLAADAVSHALRIPTAGLDHLLLAAQKRWLGRLRE